MQLPDPNDEEACNQPDARLAIAQSGVKRGREWIDNGLIQLETADAESILVLFDFIDSIGTMSKPIAVEPDWEKIEKATRDVDLVVEGCKQMLASGLSEKEAQGIRLFLHILIACADTLSEYCWQHVIKANIKETAKKVSEAVESVPVPPAVFEALHRLSALVIEDRDLPDDEISQVAEDLDAADQALKQPDWKRSDMATICGATSAISRWVTERYAKQLEKKL